MDQPTEFATAPSPYHPGVTVLRVKGFLDVNAAPALEREFEDLLKQGRARVLVDLAEVSYISSAGLGVFVGFLREFRARPEGDVKLVHVSAKLFKVFQAIGLDEMMDFLEAEAAVAPWNVKAPLEDRLHHFTLTVDRHEVICGREFPLRVEARDVAGQVVADYRGTPKLIVTSGLILPRDLGGFHGGAWAGKAVVTDSGLLSLILVDGQVESRFNLLVREDPAKAEFPRSVACRNCGRQAVVRGMDIYRCAQCDEIFYVDAWANVISLKPGAATRRPPSRTKGMRLRINADVNYLNSIRRFLHGLCEQENLGDVFINEVVLTCEEALLNLFEHSHKFDPRQVVSLSLQFQKHQLTVQIRDYGEPYDITRHKTVSLKSCIQKGLKGGVGGMLINQLMDRVAYRTYPRYNQLTLVKRYPRPGAAAGA